MSINSKFTVIRGWNELFRSPSRIPGVLGVYPDPSAGRCNAVIITHTRNADKIADVFKDQTNGNVILELNP